jgi:hypothetical protein
LSSPPVVPFGVTWSVLTYQHRRRAGQIQFGAKVIF